MSRLSSTGTSFWSKLSLAYLIASCFSRAARFLKLSKSADGAQQAFPVLVRPGRPLFEFRQLLRGHCRRLDGHQWFRRSEGFGPCRLLFNVRVGFLHRHGMPVQNLNAGRISDGWQGGNLDVLGMRPGAVSRHRHQCAAVLSRSSASHATRSKCSETRPCACGLRLRTAARRAISRRIAEPRHCGGAS